MSDLISKGEMNDLISKISELKKAIHEGMDADIISINHLVDSNSHGGGVEYIQGKIASSSQILKKINELFGDNL